MKKLAILSTMLTLSVALAVAPKDTLVVQESADIPTCLLYTSPSPRD